MDKAAYARAVLELGYAAADGLPVLGDALELLDRYIGAETLTVASFDAIHGTQGEIALRGAPPLTEAEQAEWMRLIPTYTYARWIAVAPVLTSRLTDVVPIEVFERTEIFQTLLRPRGHRYQASLVLDRRPQALTSISLWRDRTDFADVDVEAMELARQVLVSGLEHHAAIERARAWVATDPRGRVLTPRQAQVTALVARGLTNEQIARRLEISPRTVRKHVSDIFAATGGRSRTEVAFWWSEGGRRAT